MATSVQFYHLLTTPVDRALPKLLEKAFSGGFKILLVAGSDEQVEHLNHVLWTYDPNSFLPHGSAKDGDAPDQPIFLSTGFETPNNASILVVTNGSTPDSPERFERILDMFDGNDQQAVENARNRWTSYKNSGCPVTYMRQTQTGGWEQKAVA